MKNNLFTKAILTATIALATLPALFAGIPEKNTTQVEFRPVPTDFENLPSRESEKWNFGFRPYGAEAASFLWSDPTVIRNAATGAEMDAKKLPTAIYVCCDEYGLNILIYGASVRHGIRVDDVSAECFFIPGDNDSHKITGYQPFGFTGGKFSYNLMWMKQDRNNRIMFDRMKFDRHDNANGSVVKIFIPWDICWDTLPVFKEKRDNFWRLSMIRWGGSNGAETWGGVVHSQSKCGYMRMPDFTEEQESKILRATLCALWRNYSETVGDTAINPGRVGESMNDYRKSIEKLPHSWMNVNEDPEFRPTLEKLIAERTEIGKQLDGPFAEMSLKEQKDFYLKNAPKLANFRYDVEAAYAQHLTQKMLKR